jgi:lipopolysaccharide/colanic/teichoic acid biosynthesis glycosyltransferase/anti-sigma regulatory factor (Ser/Thr protein kinase)
MTFLQVPARVDEVSRFASLINQSLGPGYMCGRAHAAITEALLNAVIYGALRLPSSGEREPGELLGQIRDAERILAGRDLSVEAVTADDGDDKVVRVRDPGPGFDWRRPAPDFPDVESTRGRGLLIMRRGTCALSWNESGNEVSLRFRRTDLRSARLQRGSLRRLRETLDAGLRTLMPSPTAVPGGSTHDQLPPALAGPVARTVARVERVVTRTRCDGARALGPVVRRALDVAFGASALVAVAPLLVAAATVVKLTSSGPAFIRQTRVGRGGRLFTLYKLRSMYADAESRRAELEKFNESRGGVTFKIRADPRVTPVGRVLRRLSVDELPQLWNVVNGTMSILGPRPPLASEVAKYGPQARRRLERKPGLTALWQVSGRADLSFSEQVALDLRFIDTLSPLDEALVVARTVPAVLTGRGAY